MSQTQSPAAAGSYQGTPPPPPADLTALLAPVLPPPAAHAPDQDGAERLFAAWSIGIPKAPPRCTEVSFFGPVGRRRSSLGVAVLSLLTLGLSGVRWHARANREMGDFDPRMAVDARRSTAAVAVPVLITWAIAVGAALRLLLVHAGMDVRLPVTQGMTPWLLGAPLLASYLMLLLPFSLVAVVRTAERVRIVEDRVDITGSRQLRPATVVCWLLLPLVGAPVMIAVLQRRLNAVFARVATP